MKKIYLIYSHDPSIKNYIFLSGNSKLPLSIYERNKSFVVHSDSDNYMSKGKTVNVVSEFIDIVGNIDDMKNDCDTLKNDFDIKKVVLSKGEGQTKFSFAIKDILAVKTFVGSVENFDIKFEKLPLYFANSKDPDLLIEESEAKIETKLTQKTDEDFVF